jgi:tRNA threonylcarbamoyladenosine biosynthesis protein TsaE
VSDQQKLVTIGVMEAPEIAGGLKLATHSPLETEHLGQHLGQHLQPGDLICLAGDLGAGKTCFVRGLARGWGAVERPTSPTFTLINEYHRQADARRLYHVDCYRLGSARDAQSTGLDDVLASGDVVVIEWPERILAILPDQRLWIALRDAGEIDRLLLISASGPRAEALLGRLVP